MSVEEEKRVGKGEVVSGYEILRRRAVDAVGENGEGHGWSLLVSRGMRAWLRAFSSYDGSDVSPADAQRREEAFEADAVDPIIPDDFYAVDPVPPDDDAPT